MCGFVGDDVVRQAGEDQAHPASLVAVSASVEVAEEASPFVRTVVGVGLAQGVRVDAERLHVLVGRRLAGISGVTAATRAPDAPAPVRSGRWSSWPRRRPSADGTADCRPTARGRLREQVRIVEVHRGVVAALGGSTSMTSRYSPTGPGFRSFSQHTDSSTSLSSKNLMSLLSRGSRA